jgi:DNA-binding IclR family transcriptional regulator
MSMRPRGAIVAYSLETIRCLTSGRWRAAELAEHLGYHRRTVYRILRSLADLDLGLERWIDGPEAYYRIRPERLRAYLGLTRPRRSTARPRA